MSMDELVTDKKYSETKGSSGSGSTRSSRDYPDCGEMVANFVLANLKAYDGEYHVPAHNDDQEADELPEEIAEKLDLEPGTTDTLEGVFGVEIDGEYVGTAGDLEPENGELDRHATILVQKALNGYHSDLIEEQFPGSSISVGVGSSTRDWDDEKRNQWVRFKVVDTEKAERTRQRARLDVGAIDEEEYVSWCIENEMDPWPRRDGAKTWEEYQDEQEEDEEEDEEEDDE
jgi:hypothetical protein